MKHKWDQAGGHWQCFLLSTLTLHFAHQHISRNSAIGPFLYMYSRLLEDRDPKQAPSEVFYVPPQRITSAAFECSLQC